MRARKKMSALAKCCINSITKRVHSAILFNVVHGISLGLLIEALHAVCVGGGGLKPQRFNF